MEILAAHPYTSPRDRALTPEEAWVREVAYGIKNGDPASIQVAAQAMAPLIPRGASIVPAPSSEAGGFGGVLLLAELLADMTSSKLRPKVRRSITVTSSHLRRQEGKPGLGVEEHLASMELAGRRPIEGRAFLVDNVATTGATLEAVRKTLGLPEDQVTGLVWARAREPMKTVCAYCGVHMKGPALAALVTHAACPGCYERALREARAAALARRKKP